MPKKYYDTNSKNVVLLNKKQVNVFMILDVIFENKIV